MKCRRVNHLKDPYDIFIGRPSKWGNPFSYKKYSTSTYKVSSRRESIDKHKEWLLSGDGRFLLDQLHELSGKKISCWCNTNQTCHGDILVELVNNLGKRGLEQFF